MPDITMCKGVIERAETEADINIDCPLKENCYKYTANPTTLPDGRVIQSYWVGTPYNHREEKCDEFQQNNKT